jgi:hypothetical protein
MLDTMTSSEPAICLTLGAAISFVVSFLKRIPLVKRNPKVVAFVLATLSSVLMPLVGANPVTWKVIVMCVLAQFAASVTTHEAVVNPIQEKSGR